MEVIETVLIILIILLVITGAIVSWPMSKHLIAETKIKRIGFLQMIFYLKDYYKMMLEETDEIKKKKFRIHYIIFMVANLGFILFAILLFFLPGTSV